MSSSQKSIIIVGAGIAGLTVAKLLKEKGCKILILEASDGIGGRVRTDEREGFLLDRGFQVLLTAYPEAKRILDYKALNLKNFTPGAKILHAKGITEIVDPLRKPSGLFKTIFSSAGSLGDKIQMLTLKMQLKKQSIVQIFEQPEQSTDSYLLKKGFSDKMIAHFFRPFLTGIFLENNLLTSNRMFDFVFKMFSEGDTAIPAKGMGEIPKQLAKNLQQDEIIFNDAVVLVGDKQVKTKNGKIYKADLIVIATDQDHIPAPYQQTKHQKRSVTNLYFTAKNAPFKAPIIALNANAGALVNNMAVMNKVSKDYSKSGEALISVSIIKDVSEMHPDELIANVKTELSFWFKEALTWKYLHSYAIPYALPDQTYVRANVSKKELKLDEYVYQCGDFLLNGSINAAIFSGKKVAELILEN